MLGIRKSKRSKWKDIIPLLVGDIIGILTLGRYAVYYSEKAKRPTVQRRVAFVSYWEIYQGIWVRFAHNLVYLFSFGRLTTNWFDRYWGQNRC